MSVRALAVTTLLTAMSAAAPAFAQTAPVDPGIDQRIRNLPAPGDAARQAEEEAILTGRDDILLMRRRRFFTLYGSAGINGTTNAGLSPTDPVDDQFANADVGIRIATRLGGAVNVYAEAGLSSTRYFEQDRLDLVAAFGAVGANVELAGFDLDAAYAPVIAWDADWDERQLTQHRFTGSIGRSARVGPVLVRAAVGGERIEADPEPFANSAAVGSLSGFWPLGTNLAVMASVRGARRWYDDYFEGLLGVERKDWFVEGALGLSYRPAAAITLDMRWTYARNWSTADVSRYEAATGGIAVRAAVRF